MSIRTKLKVSAAITIGLALVVAFTVLVASRNMEEAARNDSFSDRVIKDVSDLNSLSYAYLLLKDKRPKAQWQIKHESLGKVLSEHTVRSPEAEALLAKLRSDHEQMKNLFDLISKRIEQGKPASQKGSPSYDELNEGITAQLMARSETMVRDASLLNRESERQTDAARRISLILILVSALLLAISAAVTAIILARSIGGPIRILERGTQRIASGDIGHLIPVVGNDEISRLSASFNDMASKLADSYSTLENRVKERTEALKESEQRWATTLSSIGDAVIATDAAGKITFMNAIAEEMTGWELTEAVTRPIPEVFNIINEHTRGEVESPVTKVLREGTIVGLANHTILVRKDGTEVAIDDSGAPIRNADGKTTGVVLVFRDITQRKVEEEHTRYLASFPRFNPNPIVEVNLSGDITFCNRGWGDVPGESRFGQRGLQIFSAHRYGIDPQQLGQEKRVDAEKRGYN